LLLDPCAAPMTPALRRAVAATDATTGPRYGVVRGITVYEASGTAIARGTAHHEGDAHPTLANYPSLAVTLRKDPALTPVLTSRRAVSPHLSRNRTGSRESRAIPGQVSGNVTQGVIALAVEARICGVVGVDDVLGNPTTSHLRACWAPEGTFRTPDAPLLPSPQPRDHTSADR